MRRRIARLRDSGNLAWSVAATIISLIAIAPVVTIFVLALQSSGDTWSHLVANVLPGAVRRTLALMAGVGALTLLIGTGPLSRAKRVSVAAAPAARHPDLHHRLLLSGAVRL